MDEKNTYQNLYNTLNTIKYEKKYEYNINTQIELPRGPFLNGNNQTIT